MRSPLVVERFNRMGREGIEALGRPRQVPSLAVERAEAINIVLTVSVGGQVIAVNADDAMSRPAFPKLPANRT